MRLGVAAAVVDGALVAGDVDVDVDDGRIVAVGLAPGPGSGAGRGVAVAGFVDWQVNGFGGVHFGSAAPEDLVSAETALAMAGIVFAAPTYFSLTSREYLRCLGVLGEHRAAHPGGGLVRAHLEGPFLSPQRSGAHSEATFLDGDVALAHRFVATGQVGLVTVAPERQGVLDVIPVLSSGGAVVSLGHTDADLPTCRLAEAAGATAITHCWNAHRPLASRDPGPAGWALSTPGITVGLIADGHHVAPEVLALTISAARGRVAATTDAIAPTGTTAVQWQSGGISVSISEGTARLADGTLAGSVATPSQMLGVLLDAGVGYEDAVHALSAPQASALGLGEWRMRPGDPAHVTVLGDDLTVLAAYRGGRRLG